MRFESFLARDVHSCTREMDAFGRFLFMVRALLNVRGKKGVATAFLTSNLRL